MRDSLMRFQVNSRDVCFHFFFVVTSLVPTGAKRKGGGVGRSKANRRRQQQDAQAVAEAAELSSEDEAGNPIKVEGAPNVHNMSSAQLEVYLKVNSVNVASWETT